MRHKLPVLRASATTRWLNCTFFSAHEWPEQPGSEAAEFGRRVHAGIAKAFRSDIKDEGPRDEEEQAVAMIGINYAHELVKGIGSAWTALYETTMEYQGEVDHISGTADMVLVSPAEDYAVLVDWKTGMRHGGYEDQMRTYAWLLSRAYPKLTKVDVRLVYLSNGEEDRMMIHREDIQQHDLRIMGAVSDRSETEPVATPGHWCQWCPGSISCPKNAAMEVAVTQAANLAVNVAKLATVVENEDEAVVAHALVAYATEVIARIESNLKEYVRDHGPVKTREGQTYGFSKATRQTLDATPKALEVIEAAGCGDVIKPTASWTDVKKKLAKNAVALETLEAALKVAGALKTTEYERWATK